MKYRLRNTVTRDRFNELTFFHTNVLAVWFDRFSSTILTDYKGKHNVVTDGISKYGYNDKSFEELYEEVK